MPRGGARAGAGRLKGGHNRKTKLIAEQAAAQGITPLEVMLEAMRQHYDAGRLDRAAFVAKDIAPYMHPKLISTEQKIDADVRQRVVSGEPLGDDEWERRYANAGNYLGPTNGAAKGPH